MVRITVDLPDETAERLRRATGKNRAAAFRACHSGR